jgi:AraC-like DNA-binding protein
MKVTDYPPSPLLREYVLAYKVIESDDSVVNPLLPDTTLALAFRLQGNVNYKDGHGALPVAPISLSGLRNNVREVQYERTTTTLVALLSPLGASQVFREPLNQFYNLIVNAGDLSSISFNQLQDQLLSAVTMQRRIAVIDRFLIDRVKDLRFDPIIIHAVKRLSESHGLVRIRALSKELCLSQDAFEKRFRKYVGATPKQFANIVRMRSVLKQKSADLAQVAYDHEFYDPAHFSKSFKQFTGQNPTAFFSKPGFW